MRKYLFQWLALCMLLTIGCDKDSSHDWQKDRDALIGKWEVNSEFRIKFIEGDSVISNSYTLEFIDQKRCIIYDFNFLTFETLVDYYYQPAPETVIFDGEIPQLLNRANLPKVNSIRSKSNNSQVWYGESEMFTFDTNQNIKIISVEVNSILTKQ